MMITTLLMLPLQEQHPSTYNSGKIHRRRRSSNLELALYQVIHLITGVWGKKKNNNKKTLCYLMPLLTSNRPNKKKTKPALSYPARVNTIALFCESSWWVSRCSIELQIQRARKGRRVKYVIVYGCCSIVSFFRVNNILTHYLLPLASLRSTRGNELSGIDCHVCAAMCSSPRHSSPGVKTICHLRFMLCFLHVPTYE